ncbi:tRNA preQ1(34) S-adenosylmethionine ribosyltransferase-isomerase QueA [Campylobacter mucosalis]|uniref:tRNA preQ1(34) S-adenosylmethionine ribosyltransferase-isomerase QueA n=1 Tax=Campylobacter mucosalis TaxID=202 RepID=UPI00147025C7|nr:tRNA preQ1(34) S-adenosylmethionine ribosyltransferase-isomerase QueA [Campylobacter mucosalis]
MSDINSLLSYDYYLPPELIANEPVMPQENARLLVYHKDTGEIEHLKFQDFVQILPKDTAIIFNDTKVIKARIYGHKQSGGAVELLLNQPVNDNNFSCYIKGRVNVGSILNFSSDIKAEIIELKDDGLRIVKFYKNSKNLSQSDLYNELDKIGHVPLPPYIKRDDTQQDVSWYQSVFAKNSGAVAAPTASLHFSDKMIKEINENFKTAYITLHVGAGTFKGVECDDITKHVMHSEFYDISAQAQQLITSDVTLLGVGTTSTRCIEYYARGASSSGFCDLFLNLNNRPIRQNYLLTNFHLPKSTLIMLVSSFIGLDETMRIYKTAIEQRYRFYSYGDGMLII